MLNLTNHGSTVGAMLASLVVGRIKHCEVFTSFESTTPCGRRKRRPYNSRFSKSRLVLCCLMYVSIFLALYRALVFARLRRDSQAKCIWLEQMTPCLPVTVAPGGYKTHLFTS